MKLGELFIKLSTKGDTKNLEKALKQLKEAEKETRTQLKLKRDLAKATTEEEKELIRKNYAQKKEIDVTKKLINQQKERNKAIMAGIKGFAGFITAVSLAIGVVDRFVNASAKANQSILTISQSSGMSADLINKYASASMDKNINVTRENVAQTINSLSQKLRGMKLGEVDEGMLQGMQLLQVMGGKSFSPYGLNTEQFLEGLRGSLVGIDDEWASDILQRMGISPDLLPMLRMSKEEFDKTKNRFMNEKQMTDQQKAVQELAKISSHIKLIFEKLSNDLIPTLTSIFNIVDKLLTAFEKVYENKLKKAKEYLSGDDISENVDETTKNNIVNDRRKTAVMSYVLWAMKNKKMPPQMALALAGIYGAVGTTQNLMNGLKNDAIEKNELSDFLKLSSFASDYAVSHVNTFNTTINTTQPADKAFGDNYQREVLNAQNNQQKVSR